MKTKTENFEVLVPNLDGTDVAERVTVTIPMEWDEELKEWLLTAEAHQIIEDTKARHMGLLLPAQLKELRLRHDLTQKEMGELFQVGEKSWTRWESGKHRPSRSINLMIRSLYEGEMSLNYLLKQAGKEPCEAEIAKTEKSPWVDIEYASLISDLKYDTSGVVVKFCCQIKRQEQSKYPQAMLLQAMRQSRKQWSGIVVSGKSENMLENCTSKRFDYEKTSIA